MNLRFSFPKARAAALLLAAGSAVFFLHLAASLGNPPGVLEDDAVQIMLARSLRHGAFALPDAQGTPVTDPLPGLALLLLLPVWLLEPHWGALRLLAVGGAALAALLTRRLALRFLSPGEAAAAAVLAALSPVLLRHAGLVIPDIALLVVSLLLILKLPKARSSRDLALLAAGAALASLLRPHGALLAVCLGLALWQTRGPLRALGFLALSLAPLAVWTIRNRWLTRTVTGYVLNWRSQVALLGDLRHQINHAARIVMRFFGEGLLGMDDFSLKWKLAAGLTILALAALGARRLLRERRQPPEVFAMAAYAILVLALHMTWLPVEARYVIVILPFAWILAIAGLTDHHGSRAPAALAGLCLAALLALRMDLGLLKGSLARPRDFQGQTMRWLRENTDPGSRIESLEYNAVMLLSQRRSFPPSLESRDAREWLAAAGGNQISYLHVESAFTPGGFLPAKADYVASRLGYWAQSRPEVRLVYENPAERTRIFALPSGRVSRNP